MNEFYHLKGAQVHKIKKGLKYLFEPSVEQLDLKLLYKALQKLTGYHLYGTQIIGTVKYELDAEANVGSFNNKTKSVWESILVMRNFHSNPITSPGIEIINKYICDVKLGAYSVTGTVSSQEFTSGSKEPDDLICNMIIHDQNGNLLTNEFIHELEPNMFFNVFGNNHSIVFGKIQFSKEFGDVNGKKIDLIIIE